MTEDIEKFERRSPGTEITVSEGVGPMEIMMAAVKRGSGKEELEILRGMFDLQKQIDADNNRKLYVDAMSKWKAEAPEIIKDKTVSYQTGKGETQYKHATLGNVTESIRKSMSPFGLHTSWKTDQPEGKVKVTCTISHSAGHSESTSLTADMDTSGSKNPIQSMGSTITYLERYTLLALTGLATHDQDDDGNAAGGQDDFITKDQQKILADLIDDTRTDVDKFLKAAKAETADTILQSKYQMLKNQLERKKSKMGE